MQSKQGTKHLTRRCFLSATAGGTMAVPARALQKADRTPVPSSRSVPMLHVTDLYRPHEDPDDHWDLACVFALAYGGDADLRRVVIDHSLTLDNRVHDPDVLAVAQLNYMTALSVPVSVGSPDRMTSRSDVSAANHGGVRAILQTLQDAPRPVVISILGSSRDVAIAGKKAPRLFADKCAGIYLNAGLGTRNVNLPKELRFDRANVNRDILGFAAIFDLPCPVYWMPVLETWDLDLIRTGAVHECATMYGFEQGEILPFLSRMAKNYFGYMYRDGRFTDRPRTPELRWLRYLLSQPEQDVLDHQGAQNRFMWCTAGFFHAAGKTVDREGRIVLLAEGAKNAVFEFRRARISCDDTGLTEWAFDEKAKDRFVFRVTDTGSYARAMTVAMKTLLMTLP